MAQRVENTKFGQDHYNRMSPLDYVDGVYCYPNGITLTTQEVEDAGNDVCLCAGPDGKACLLGDARYYADPLGPTEDDPGLRLSAIAVVKRLTNE